MRTITTLIAIIAVGTRFDANLIVNRDKASYELIGSATMQSAPPLATAETSL